MANPASAFPLSPPRFLDNGSGAKVLQPDNQVAFQSIGAAFSQAEVTALRDALIAAGIMKAS